MKKFLFILISLIFLTTCKTPKSVEITDNDVLTDLPADTTHMVILENADSISLEHSYLMVGESGMGYGSGSGRLGGGHEYVSYTVPKQPTSVNNSNVIENSQNSFGYITYYIPDTMKVGQRYKLQLRISKYNTVELNLNMDTSSVKSKIRVGSKMEAKLTDVDNVFVISTTNTPEQNIENDESYTQWIWYVTPQRKGKHILKLTVVIKENNLTKDIPVYEDDIYIQASPMFTIWGFIQKYWQWILGSVVIPFLVWWFNNRRKKKKSVVKK